MEAFVNLLSSGSIDVRPLMTHVIDIDNAERAYNIATGKIRERRLGMLLKYSDAVASDPVRKPKLAEARVAAQPQIGFIGAGSFAEKFLIPFAAESGGLYSVLTTRGITAKSVGEKFRFQAYSTDAEALLAVF